MSRAILAALGVVLAACGSMGGTASPDADGVTLTDEECVSSLPAGLPSGTTSLRVRNESAAVANFELLALDATFEELVQHVADEQARLEAGEPLAGLPAFATERSRVLLEPGQSGALSAEVAPGTFAVVCAALEGDAVTALYVVGPVSVEE